MFEYDFTEPNFKPDVQKLQEKFDQFLVSKNVFFAFISSQDEFLSEYTPLSNNLRYALSGFSGSTGDGVFVSSLAKKAGFNLKSFILAVDGRYHLQADKEVSQSLVEVLKVGTGVNQTNSLLDAIKKSSLSVSFPGPIKLAMDAKRNAWGRFIATNKFFSEHLKNFETELFNEDEFAKAISLLGWPVNRQIEILDQSLTGRTTLSNVKSLETEVLSLKNTAFILPGVDDSAWLLNARGYHFPYSSATACFCLVVQGEVIVFFPESAKDCEIDTAKLSGLKVHIVRKDLTILEDILKKFSVENIAFNFYSCNVFLPKLLQELFPKAKIHDQYQKFIHERSRKTEEELTQMRNSFLSASKAISETMRWVKKSFKEGKKISEASVAEKIAGEYKREGAKTLSFHTISAKGEMSALPHYHENKDSRVLEDSDFFLLDSGAYFKAGFATDCTRTVCALKEGSTPHAWQKEIYTLTLKACINGYMSRYPLQESGANVDKKIRDLVQSKGYDYNHGTGHGIGILVHEQGIMISKSSPYPIATNRVVSVEPGIYLEGKGGVRIENVAIVCEDETKKEQFFENIVFVGYDWDLIDINILNSEEKLYLKDYEKTCEKLGTQVTHCPL